MKRCYGTLAEGFPAEGQIGLRLCEGPLGLAWVHSGATAEFLADIFAQEAARQGLDALNARHSIAYLANELLENAVKFRAPGDVRVAASLAEGRFHFRVENLLAAAAAARFEALLGEMLAGDPGTLLIERIEANAENPEAGGSGLGILTLMNDYGASLGWTFAPWPDDLVALRTEAAMPLT
ncbi:slr1658 superfamily regulator [Acidisoma sp. C75]